MRIRMVYKQPIWFKPTISHIVIVCSLWPTGLPSHVISIDFLSHVGLRIVVIHQFPGLSFYLSNSTGDLQDMASDPRGLSPWQTGMFHPSVKGFSKDQPISIKPCVQATISEHRESKQNVHSLFSKTCTLFGIFFINALIFSVCAGADALFVFVQRNSSTVVMTYC